MIKLNAEQLRDIAAAKAKKHLRKLKRNPIYLILENVYDTYNIGGLFRLADALAIEKIYLCGEMETPPNSRILKASVGTYKIVPWVYKETAKEAIEELRSKYVIPNSVRDPKEMLNQVQHDDRNPPIKIIAIEQSKKSLPYIDVDYSFPVALVVGNETFGVIKETLKAVDQIVEIPMWGINKSLNVIVSAAIVGYHISKGF
ncbi:hypothetical protein A3A93_04340 [Candidatus Roizmanbacteria bacterium RIFCSPLOWO2_01_FULL_38_12]|uniref:tRNA/rRNA methyltransferase SpoU type domain-containing protein n=1 Tax=Candidatus Roizmanbacteria bacterium RIFCSPLOWO2_01_FULL_38_12 TaxID=1802061 RepID=A0A1F7IXB1_9BACT|nr:MAG: hypothetical protein A2861_01155 [Candidatus Roizmanbacteria bacterium RIFCSPHIGHO2_01_FULL_38_15]OGK35469.1 MAG: hypothetical protein A3F59_00845 [Candidatus Roizmanbacteria bacterium RIFCSPHIGHO2_12_FULL_38_13]OGK48002.1 MAG: hypothetical protein A3A93_04340 [Candidatus Roizmanbacteria bacterium RIFCSPLOWO2_01_FULL_38_12]